MAEREDIHLFVEVRRDPHGPWQLAPVTYKCTWCEGTKKAHNGAECFACKGTALMTGYAERSAPVFAMLGSVKHKDLGYARLPFTGGLPPDLGPELGALVKRHPEHDSTKKEEFGAAYLGEYGRGYITLAQLDRPEFWKQAVAQQGTVRLSDLCAWRQRKLPAPPRHHGETSGGYVRELPLPAAEELAKCCRYGEEELRDYLISCELTPKAKAGWKKAGHEPKELLKFAGTAFASRAPKGIPKKVYAQLVKAEASTVGGYFQAPLRIVAKATWGSTHDAAAGTFRERFTPAMRKLGLPGSRVRLVFGFDD
jgi:hypothetical protein